MSAITALEAARAAGIRLKVEGDDLVLEASTAPPSTVLDLLSRNKAGIATMLRPDLSGWSTDTATPEPASMPRRAGNSTEQPTLADGCPTGYESEVRAQPARAEPATAPVVEFSFARLVRDYPHPQGGRGVECPAYYPHARGIWSKITTEQKHDAVRAASRAPGKQWLGHWLNGARETGKFEITKQRAVAPRVWVRKDTPQWAAWAADGRCQLTTQHRVNGELQTGWLFESEWPPNFKLVQRGGGGA